MEETPLKVLIPMAGMGKRFLEAGYNTPKPLIPVDGRPIISHILRQFSPEDHFVFGINEEHKRNSPILDVLHSLVPDAEILTMPYQKEGPVASVKHMLAAVSDDERVVINYCDFSWVWDYADFRKAIRQSDCDGAVICYRGFHPHLLSERKYATLDADGLWMKEIREKFSWHKNKQSDWTSSGTYYFKRGAYVKKYLRAMESRKDLILNGEQYISQLFQLMKEDGLKILIYQIPFMLQWGTPEDLEHYLYWSSYFKSKQFIPADRETYDMTVLMLMAGAGKRFSDVGYAVPKPFIPVDGGAMVLRATESLPRGRRTVFISRDELKNPEGETALARRFQSAEFIHLNKLTEGQAATALEGKSKIDSEKPLLIGACDHSILYEAENFRRAIKEMDALIFTYRHNPTVRLKPEMYGWVETGAGNTAKRVSVKIPLAGDPAENHAIVGAFWFKKARYFIENAEQMIRDNRRTGVGREFYIDECMNYLIEKGLKVQVFEVAKHASWGTPDELKTYDYWQKFFSQASFHPYSQRSNLKNQDSKPPKLSVVVPCYNEEKNIPLIAEGFAKALKDIPGAELILVDNGSKDATGAAIDREIAARGAWLKKSIVRMNQGYGHGVLSGLRQASGNVLAWTHADLQTDPEDVARAWKLYLETGEGKILVKGHRENRAASEKIFSFGMQVLSSLMLGTWLSEVNAQPKLFPRSLLDEMANPPQDFSLDLYLLYLAKKKHYRILSLPVYFKKRLHGEAKGGGGSNFKTRWKLIARTWKYICELRDKIRKGN